MTKRLLISLSIVLVAIYMCNGQTLITGRIIDSNTKKGIKDAHVKLENRDSIVVTNILGFFQIKADTSDHIFVGATKYETVKFKVPFSKNFSILLTQKKEEIYLIVEEPARPLNFEVFKKHLANGFSCSTNRNSGELIIDFITLKDGSLNNAIILENSYKMECEKVMIDLLSNSPNWRPALQRNLPVLQRHRLKIIIFNDKIENVYKLPPSLDAASTMTLQMTRNLNLPKRLKNTSTTFEIYMCFENNKSTRSIEKLKLINCSDKELENELIGMINRIPYQVIYDLYPDNTRLIQPILILINSNIKPQRTIELPEGDVQDEISINFKKGKNER